MFTEKQLDMLREGKIPLQFTGSGMPVFVANAPIFELMLFVRALAKGYMRLYNRAKFLEKIANSNLAQRKSNGAKSR